uniref:Uncharacterized protein n=1 Tax=Rhizophora mucronata TaxID=61149 RepID=A0A2P2PE18_RHIMU
MQLCSQNINQIKLETFQGSPQHN